MNSQEYRDYTDRILMQFQRKEPVFHPFDPEISELCFGFFNTTMQEAFAGFSVEEHFEDTVKRIVKYLGCLSVEEVLESYTKIQLYKVTKNNMINIHPYYMYRTYLRYRNNARMYKIIEQARTSILHYTNHTSNLVPDKTTHAIFYPNLNIEELYDNIDMKDFLTNKTYFYEICNKYNLFEEQWSDYVFNRYMKRQDEFYKSTSNEDKLPTDFKEYVDAMIAKLDTMNQIKAVDISNGHKEIFIDELMYLLDMKYTIINHHKIDGFKHGMEIFCNGIANMNNPEGLKNMGLMYEICIPLLDFLSLVSSCCETRKFDDVYTNILPTTQM